MRHTILYLILCVAIINSDNLRAQFHAVNMAEYQFGNIPEVEPDNLQSLYNQLNLSYRYKNLSASSRLEYFTASDGENRDYLKPTQLKLSYNTKLISLDAGHIYSSLGRGLLLRSYEIPASVFETRGYRVRHGYYKDMEGISAKLKTTYVDITALRGRTLTLDIPPTVDYSDRRNDLVEGAAIESTIDNQTLGLIFMRHRNNETRHDYLSTFYSGSIKNVTIYTELAKQTDSLSAISSFAKEDAWGGYVGLNYIWNNMGISVEYKDYHNFLIGNGVNEPPTLIKEHHWIVLNRSTHVPLLNDESGYQVEVYYSFENGNGITLNHALSQNNIGNATYTFEEYHVDYSATIGDKIDLRAFLNYSKAPFVNETNRFALGNITDIKHGNQFSSSLNIEYQRINRDGGRGISYIDNGAVSYTFSKSNTYSTSLLLEVSNDPFLIRAGSNQEYYPSVTVNYNLSRKHKLSAFVGKRRGGPACTSGVCYDVLDFEGAELRFTSRLF